MRKRLAVAVVILAVSATPAAADEQGAPPPENHPGSSRDFLFGRPRASATIRGTWVFARAGSDLFDFITDHLTIDRRDFDAPAVSLDVGIVITPRIEAVAGFEYSTTTTASEYRRLVDNNFLPITQQTELSQVALTGSIKVALTPRGRRISRLAWIPRGLTPFVGGGAGAVRYEFLQRGDFVDYVDLSVFTDIFHSRGWSPSAHAFGGVDMQIYRMLFFTVEGRYVWASGKLGTDFVNFDPIDLSGFRTSAGVSVVF